ncbi:peptidase C14 [Epithele typhae]|uniref:peptidase C14 n=1 Tax=Epithele typhae TaxID=378194 RepID=UPI0020081EDB|nr:peptidase C14 [Epithele typhae]KAH9941631.1 peptidase C14 [Epithele typhae]
MPVPVTTSRPQVKKALLVGVSYQTNDELQMQGMDKLPGSLEDVRRLRKLLNVKFKYPIENIVMMTDDEVSTGDDLWPTKENVLRKMKELVQDVQYGDSICFAFSGHGGQVATDDPQEEDGFDEVLLPLDATYDPDNKEQYGAYIRDNDVRDILVNNLPPGVRCTMIFDCCHSGTASDLSNVEVPMSPLSPLVSPPIQSSGAFARMQTVHDEHAPSAYSWPSSRVPGSRRNSLSIENYVTSWSACRDEQLTFGSNKGGIFIRAFYNALIHTTSLPTHSQLLKKLRHELQNAVNRINDHHKGVHTACSGDDLMVAPRPQLGALSPQAILDISFSL